jgi:hypothetical protein
MRLNIGSMEGTRTHRPAWLSPVALAMLLLGPFAFITAYFYATSLCHFHSDIGDIGAFAVGVFIGVAGLWLAPASRVTRAAVTIPYIAIFSVLTFLWAASLVCAFFGACF